MTNLQVLLEVLLAERRPEELAEEPDDVVLEPVTVHDRDDVVRVRREGRGRHLREVVLQGRTLVREDQARLVEAVPAEHAADGIGDEILRRPVVPELAPRGASRVR